MTPFAKQQIRLAVNPANPGPVSNKLGTNSAEVPQFVKGAPLDIRIGCLLGDTGLVDVTEYSAITVEIKLGWDDAPAFVAGASGTAITSMSATGWRDGTEQNALIQLSPADTDIDIGGNDKASAYMVVRAQLADGSGDTPLGWGLVQIYDDGWTAAPADQQQRVLGTDGLWYPLGVNTTSGNQPFLAIIGPPSTTAGRPMRKIQGDDGMWYPIGVMVIGGTPILAVTGAPTANP